MIHAFIYIPLISVLEPPKQADVIGNLIIQIALISSYTHMFF